MGKHRVEGAYQGLGTTLGGTCYTPPWSAGWSSQAMQLYRDLYAIHAEAMTLPGTPFNNGDKVHIKVRDTYNGMRLSEDEVKAIKDRFEGLEFIVFKKLTTDLMSIRCATSGLLYNAPMEWIVPACPSDRQCDCDISVLMKAGCQCGGV